jgi:hypothetical protein
VIAGGGRRERGQLVDVGARHECLLAGAGHHNRPDLLVVLQGEHRTSQLVERLGVERVQNLGSVDRDDRDGLVAIDEQVVERHT